MDTEDQDILGHVILAHTGTSLDSIDKMVSD